MLVTEELFLLFTDDDSGKTASSPTDMMGFGDAAQIALHAGLLTDLAAFGLITFSSDKDARVNVTGQPTDHPLLTKAVAELQQHPNIKVSSLMGESWFADADAIAAPLIAAGILEKTSGGFFGMSTRYPTVDGRPESEIRARYSDVLQERRNPTPQEAIVLHILAVTETTTEALKDEVNATGAWRKNTLAKEIASRVLDSNEVAALAGVKNAIAALMVLGQVTYMNNMNIIRGSSD